MAVRYLTGDTHPDHDTICKFRREILQAVSMAFVEILELAREMGLLKLGKASALLADAGYVEQLESSGCEAYVSVSSENAHKERSYDYRPPDKIKAPKRIIDPLLLAMREKLSSKEGKAIYKLRCQTIETVFGVIKEVLGFRSFLLRGLEKMKGEWELACLSYNCKRLHKLIQQR